MSAFAQVRTVRSYADLVEYLEACTLNSDRPPLGWMPASPMRMVAMVVTELERVKDEGP